jgi:tripartite-type tricarboxylate transporter receptor subunit TctC
MTQRGVRSTAGRYLLVGLGALLLTGTGKSFADDTAFFENRQLRLIVAGEAGGGFDAYARVVERHLGRLIPGLPTIVVQYMPGASGLIGTNYLYTNAPRDGSAMGAIPSSPLMEPLFGNKNARFDPRNFGWLTSLSKSQAICVTWHTSPIKTLDDAKTREVVVSGTGAGGNNAVIPKILNRLLGTKFKVVLGYTPNGSRLALENGEAEGICGLAYETLQAASPAWFQQDKLNFLAQVGLSKMAELPNVPNALGAIANDEDRQALRLLLTPQEIGRPFLTPPEVPKERVRILRDAFAALAKDAEFRADAKKLGLSLDVIDGDGVDQLLRQAYASPERILAIAAELRDMPLPANMVGACKDRGDSKNCQ